MRLTDLVTGAFLIVFGLRWLGTVAVHRERRIRARLADPPIPRAARPPGEAHHARVGPGDDAPPPPDPSGRPDRFAHNRVPRRGRADHTGGAT